MKTEKYLEKLKRNYEATLPSKEFEESGWASLSKNLEVRHSFLPGILKMPAYLVLAVLILFSGFVGIAQGAIPGEVLYPVKRLSEEVVLKVYPKPEIKTERRASEIIKLIDKKKEEELKKTVEEFKDSVKEEKKKAREGREDDKEIKERIKRHKEEFENVSSKSSKEIGDTLKDVLEKIEDEEDEVGDENKSEEEIKGEKDSLEDRSGKD